VQPPTIADTKADPEDEDRPAQCGHCSNSCHRSPGVVFRSGATSFHAGFFCSLDCQAAAWGPDTVNAARPRRCCSPGCQAPRRDVARCKGLGPSIVKAIQCPHYVCQRHWKEEPARPGLCPCHLPHMDDDRRTGFVSESDTTDTDADPPEADLYGYKMRAGGALTHFVELLNTDRATGGAGGGSSSSGRQEPTAGDEVCGQCGLVLDSCYWHPNGGSFCSPDCFDSYWKAKTWELCFKAGAKAKTKASGRPKREKRREKAAQEPAEPSFRAGAPSAWDPERGGDPLVKSLL